MIVHDSIFSVRSASVACALLVGLPVAGCGDAGGGGSDLRVDELDGRWRERLSAVVDESLTDEEVLAKSSADNSWFALELEDGVGFAINTYDDTFGEIEVHCVVRHPITFSRTAAGWSVVEESGEVVESSGTEAYDCAIDKDYGIWTHGGEWASLHRVEIIGDALIVETDIEQPGSLFTAVFIRE
jgi:hypothetical protein